MHLIYITFPDNTEASKIATLLIEQNLAACVNIFPPMTSIYKWRGIIKQNQEVAVICKAADSAVDEIIKLVTKQHSYDCPCVIAIKPEKVSEEFLKWVETSTNLDY